ncbi:MAG TPA: ABC transporter permease subunit, partial [bacterium]|nr:ABC transporter permease subunit [bacterium]
MPNTHMIYRKEMAVFFNSPVAYIVLAVFAVMTSIFFSNTFFLNNQSDLRPLFEVVPWVFMFFVPAITMSLVARERQSGTLEFLVTLPVTDSQIIIGKFLAAFTLVATALGFSLVHFFTLIAVGKHVDVGAVLCGYFGLLLVGALYCAIGIFCS